MLIKVSVFIRYCSVLTHLCASTNSTERTAHELHQQLSLHIKVQVWITVQRYARAADLNNLIYCDCQCNEYLGSDINGNNKLRIMAKTMMP